MTKVLHQVAPEIVTDRLRLRPYRMEDFLALVALYDTDRAAFIGGRLPPAKVWDGFMSCIGHWPLRGFGGWAVEERATGLLAGEVAIHQPPHYPEIELGWLVFDGFEGRGFAYEAAVVARRFALEAARVERLVSYIDQPNRRSIALAKRLGARRDPEALTPNQDPCFVYRHK
ncbi:GNAT family N-acetyltransferase [Rhizobium alvei]|uniref:GNAT family N-acetyltransferase n=1 Tax=Rhizobium alvei TaxID=1132659 RepID=A0ABT8YK76_9HYPH|nr:GNAT family N-acetyltransferase [Rhizobium alvei]MDO6964108.1 GNAT family N-acetyltransferase [Rhizobium alvei]